MEAYHPRDTPMYTTVIHPRDTPMYTTVIHPVVYQHIHPVVYQHIHPVVYPGSPTNPKEKERDLCAEWPPPS